ERAGRRRPAHVAHGRADGRRHRRVSVAADGRSPGGRGSRLRNCRRAIVAAVAMATAAVATAAWACPDLAAAPTTRWSLTSDNGVSWLVTPCGRRFYTTGVNVLDGGELERAASGTAYAGYDWRSFASSIDVWAGATRRRLHRWGFNSAGAWSL